MSLYAANDLSVQGQSIELQGKFFTIIDMCSISPSTIEIGITKATLSCTSDLVTTSTKIELYHDGLLVGKSASFPIDFVTSRSGQSFKVVIYDTLTGGKASEDILLSKAITFSTKSLLTSSFVSKIASQMAIISQSNSASFKDISSNNNYIVSMINNIGIATEIVQKEIASLTPKALDMSITAISKDMKESSPSLGSFSTMVNQIKDLSNPEYLTDSNVEKTTQIVNEFVSYTQRLTNWDDGISASLSNIVTNIAPKISETTTMSMISKIAFSTISKSSQFTFTTTNFFPDKKPSNLIIVNAVKSSYVSMNSLSITSESKVPLVSFQLSKHKTTAQANEEIIVSHSVFKYPSSKRSITTPKRDFISQLSISSKNILEGTASFNIPLPSYASPISPLIKQTFRCITVYDMKDFQVETYCKYASNSKQYLSEFQSDSTTVVTCSCDLNYLSKQSQFSMIGVTAEYLEDDSAYRADQDAKVAAGVSVALIFVILFIVGIVLLGVGISVFLYFRKKKQMPPAQFPANSQPSIQYTTQPSSSTINTSTPDLLVAYSVNADFELGTVNAGQHWSVPNQIHLGAMDGIENVTAQNIQPTSI
ncbi:predicted protein [Naegleria gruberi]|uniref:Predicted protein n=1 Tax=Naegleria gruberi TaxID=5762 RepID=D2VDR0_NAEGR|nr:uncharacterized protein NAEGRDRAFT_67008 [Naegleria gruberi]EFC44942.1 predicted protein [Naegleria gruberi]|eukprot:XP_002677686.1 predicted protein [Naegleria gruberi strain NEG-M]